MHREREGEKGPDRSPGKATGFPAAEVFVGVPLISAARVARTAQK